MVRGMPRVSSISASLMRSVWRSRIKTRRRAGQTPSASPVGWPHQAHVSWPSRLSGPAGVRFAVFGGPAIVRTYSSTTLPGWQEPNSNEPASAPPRSLSHLGHGDENLSTQVRLHSVRHFFRELPGLDARVLDLLGPGHGPIPLGPSTRQAASAGAGSVACPETEHPRPAWPDSPSFGPQVNPPVNIAGGERVCGDGVRT